MTKKSIVDDKLSEECRACKRVKKNGGICSGRGFTATPCLAFISAKKGVKR